ncbi:MAG TPA: ferrous iron transport protein B, partial [Firmicutes bacterium]|nr:ferrous iron transport protein B [Bacillota bacterium]
PRAGTGSKAPQIAALVEPWRDRFPSAAEALLYLEDDHSVRPSRPAAKEKRRQEEIYLLRRRRVNEIVAAVVKESTAVDSFAARLGRIMLRSTTGIPMLLLSLLAMYYFIGVIIARVVVALTEEVVMEGYYVPLMDGLVGRIFAPTSITRYILTGEYGLLTMTVVYLLGLFMPLVAGFYFSLSFMKDSGYLPPRRHIAGQAPR